MTERYGAYVERGKVLSKEGDGYRVESWCRDGVTTLPLTYLGFGELQPGTLVYFAMFDDGKGIILHDVPAETQWGINNELTV